MSKMLKVNSNIKDYCVIFSHDFSENINRLIKDNCFFIIDKNVAELYKEKLNPVFDKCRYLIVDALETHKSYDYIKTVIKNLMEKGFKKNHKLIAVGGGIIQDIAGFVSSVLYRGIEWIFFPTTLLAQADSCIGSKTSINIDEFKNQIGTFYPPIEIVLDTNFLYTLKDEDIQSGLGEIIKVHLIDNEKSMMYALDNYDRALKDYDVIRDFIFRSLEIKKRFIEQDEYDRDYRNILNYGHTFGHAFETVTDYGFNHGQAVTIGMGLSNFLSLNYEYLSEKDYNTMTKLVQKNWPNYRKQKIYLSTYIKALFRDKKNVDDKITMILTERPGKMFKISKTFDDKLKEHIKSFFINYNFNLMS